MFDDGGRILTNAHVIRAATDISVTLADGRTVSARALGKDDVRDLALLAIDPKGLDLEPLALGNSDGVQVGDPTIALGNPTGAASTLTTGVVSAVGQRLEAADGSAIDDVIQTDAAVGAGNAGGPLLDGRGAVIGVNSHIVTRGRRRSRSPFPSTRCGPRSRSSSRPDTSTARPPGWSHGPTSSLGLVRRNFLARMWFFAEQPTQRQGRGHADREEDGRGGRRDGDGRARARGGAGGDGDGDGGRREPAGLAPRRR